MQNEIVKVENKGRNIIQLIKIIHRQINREYRILTIITVIGK